MNAPLPPPTVNQPRTPKGFHQRMESGLGVSGPMVYLVGGVAALAACLATMIYMLLP